MFDFIALALVIRVQTLWPVYLTNSKKCQFPDYAQTGDYKNGSDLTVRYVRYAFAFPRFFRIVPARRLSVHKIKEVLRLKFEVGLGLRQIARSCSIGLGTTHESPFRGGGCLPLCCPARLSFMEIIPAKPNAIPGAA
jgi:hypothetical protein